MTLSIRFTLTLTVGDRPSRVRAANHDRNSAVGGVGAGWVLQMNYSFWKVFYSGIPLCMVMPLQNYVLLRSAIFGQNWRLPLRTTVHRTKQVKLQLFRISGSQSMLAELRVPKPYRRRIAFAPEGNAVVAIQNWPL